MNPKLVRPLLAEFLGTFTLVFVGAAAVTVAENAGGLVVAALGHGLILVGLIYAYGHISGGHFNPAVTAGLLVGGKIDLTRAALYMVAQFAAAVVAALLLTGLVGSSNNFGQTMGSLTLGAPWTAAIFEAVLTFFLVSTSYQAAVYGKAGNLAPVAIGLTLAGAIFAGGVYTGASLNPARTLGPALAAGDLSYLLPYFVGIFAGGILAGLLHARLLNNN